MQEFERVYITPDEAELATGIDAATIRRAIRGGEMRCMRAGRGRGGAIHIRLNEFNRWLIAREEEASGPLKEGETYP